MSMSSGSEAMATSDQEDGAAAAQLVAMTSRCAHDHVAWVRPRARALCPGRNGA